MSKHLFKKAKMEIYNGMARQIGSGMQREYYSVIDSQSQKTHLVNIETTETGTLLTCDCTKQSLPNKENLNKGRQPLCTHIITIIAKKLAEVKIK